MVYDGHEHGHGHGHRYGHEPGHEHGRGRHHPPAEASVTPEAITARLNGARREIVTAEEHLRTLTGREGRAVPPHDVVVRATRRR
ncbi:hypothetical protein [Streptosporangium sp. NPDC002721]|uniref:hypothetical protein n=1 Tax=Streptosporangium sp. NPDC002721 TaxID=3366188 RepID=UPI00369C3B6F